MAFREKGIEHRDIRSGDIIVDGRGRVKVLDFVLARRVSSSLSYYQRIDKMS